MADAELLTEDQRESLRKELLRDRYPLPSELKPAGERPPHQRLTTVQDLVDNIRHGYPTPSEMRRRRAEREAEREAQDT